MKISFVYNNQAIEEEQSRCLTINGNSNIYNITKNISIDFESKIFVGTKVYAPRKKGSFSVFRNFLFCRTVIFTTFLYQMTFLVIFVAIGDNFDLFAIKFFKINFLHFGITQKFQTEKYA